MTEKKILFTPEQQSAIENRGGALLVSAAAGSGKTKVLVERLLGYVTDETSGAGIDDFLVITYTKAAAAELKSRITDEISSRLGRDPMNRYLRKQLNLSYKANISTIHGFCTRLIRENAHLLGISPDFRVMDETEEKTLKQAVLDRILDEEYENAEEGSDFLLLVDTMSAGRDDRKLGEIILTAYSAVQSHPYPEKWLELQKGRLGLDGVNDLSETVWGKYLMEKAKAAAKYWGGRLDKLIEEAENYPDFYKGYGKSLEGLKAQAETLLGALDRTWDEASVFGQIKAPAARASGYDELKEEKKRCEKGLQKATECFYAKSEELIADMRATAPAVDELLRLTEKLDRAFSEEKRKKHAADYSDLEHLAVRLLVDGETGERTALAEETSLRFREIMIDEYQDVNAVQELIFNAVSRNGENVFMVGDVKQSIYRFRLADPSIFLGKYVAMPMAADAEYGEARKVILSKNFRSRSGVLDAVNFIFKNIMSTEFGEMDYTPDEYLYPGAEYPETTESQVELYVIDAETGEDSTDKTDQEAEFVAQRIEDIMFSGQVSDGAGGFRKPRYSDFAILMRSVKSRAWKYARALMERGIPCDIGQSGDYFQSVEISVMVSLLSVIDNPRQDIPLISVMRSPVYGFTADDLAEIRLADKKADFWYAVRKYAENSDKCKNFVAEIESYRALAPDMTVDKLIWHIYNRTGMLGILSAMPGGSERYENLMLFFDQARIYEQAGYKGLLSFVTYLRKMMTDGAEPIKQDGADTVDAVKIMSIHKSKGLEFPFIFLADTTRQFNKSDTTKRLLVHPKLGIGTKRLDIEKKIEYPTVSRLAIAKRIESESLAEELRVLYVAMTRAREKLIITCCMANAQKELEKIISTASLPVDPFVLASAKSMAEWILTAAITRAEAEKLRFGNPCIPYDDGYKWKISYIFGNGKADEGENAADEKERVAVDREKVLRIAERLEFSYKYGYAAELPSKLTATELKEHYAVNEAAEEARVVYKTGEEVLRRPNFISGEKGLKGAAKGTAVHLALEKIELNKCSTLNGIKEELLRLYESGIMSREQYEAVEPEWVKRFFESETGQKILSADKVMREQKFLLLIPAEEIYPDSGNEEILLQGVVDCCLINNDKLTIIDYKTDYVNEFNLQSKVDLYKGQLKVYERAMSEIMGIPVEEKIIYFFSAEKGILV